MPLPVPPDRRQLALLDRLAEIPEEEIWLAKQKSACTRRAYKLDVRHFMRALGITSTDALRQVDHRAVIAWERMLREQEGEAPSTIRRRLAALSSLFKHLVKQWGGEPQSRGRCGPACDQSRRRQHGGVFEN